MKLQNNQGMAAITILFSLLIAALVIYVAVTLYTGGTDQGDVIKTPLERGKGVQCLAQVRRIEISLQMYRAQNAQYPANLNDLDELSEDEFFCPVTGNSYEYDPKTGKVICSDHP